MAEFLPLCDLLFNIVSLAAYFCDLVFDLLLIYTLYERSLTTLLLQCSAAIMITTLITQGLSLYWYFNLKPKGIKCVIVIILHILQLGVLWRYASLLTPVHLNNVKYEVRNLCILRMIHGFLQAAPMLLLQLYIILSNHHDLPLDLIIVSASLSLFSLCWALASFTKHIQTIDKFVLTWLGVVSQLLWRVGTVTSRSLALSAYASSYQTWILLVIFLHWACMFLWLLSPRSQFYGQKGYRLGICALMAAIYILAYVNIQEKPHARMMAIFYIVMLLENSLLVSAWLTAVWQARPLHWELIPILTVGLFISGILFMLLYYKFFHVKKLQKLPKQSGVFNCRFTSPSTDEFYRKKKKPTSFVPPPGFSPNSVPFWRRPLPSLSENDGSSIGSRINIHQKLQEKREKQLAELKIIEEEIKQGKLLAPEVGVFGNRQPIPKVKRHCEPQLLSLASLNNLASYGLNLNRRPPPRAPRSCTPELFLTPRYLYYDCVVVEPNNSVEMNVPHALPASDLESQVSLPRSYTLPREFKYYRHQPSHVQIVPSGNSSDGDVDSGDDESDVSSPPVVVRQVKRLRHETKL